MTVRNGWNHALCRACFAILEPAKEPKSFHSERYPNAACCHCESDAEDIWYQRDPQQMNCLGTNGVHAEVE